MPTVREVLARTPPEHLREVLGASPRRSREELYRRLGIKAKTPASGFRLSTRADDRFQRFQELLAGSSSIPEEVLSEVTRAYLYTRRTLLADALDFFAVAHDGGLTDQNLDFLGDLPVERVAECEVHLRARGHSEEDVDLYLSFMNIKR